MNLAAFEILREMTHGGAVSLRIRGDCMAPALNDGAAVAVRARRFYFPGDVLVFRTNAGDLAAHRMLGWRGAALVTKGDGCVIHDAPVAADAIVGAVDLPVRLRDRVRAMLDFARIAGRRLVRGRRPR
jgi:hypothetical protein